MKRTIDSASESITRYGYHFCFSPSEPARITGRTGRTQGASIVSAQAKNEAIISVTIEDCEKIIRSSFERVWYSPEY